MAVNCQVSKEEHSRLREVKLRKKLNGTRVSNSPGNWRLKFEKQVLQVVLARREKTGGRSLTAFHKGPRSNFEIPITRATLEGLGKVNTNRLLNISFESRPFFRFSLGKVSAAAWVLPGSEASRDTRVNFRVRRGKVINFLN